MKFFQILRFFCSFIPLFTYLISNKSKIIKSHEIVSNHFSWVALFNLWQPIFGQNVLFLGKKSNVQRDKMITSIVFCWLSAKAQQILKRRLISMYAFQENPKFDNKWNRKLITNWPEVKEMIWDLIMFIRISFWTDFCSLIFRPSKWHFKSGWHYWLTCISIQNDSKMHSNIFNFTRQP